MSDVTLHRLREANVERCETAYHRLELWTLTDWACAAAGEMGEACNVVKKIRRLGDQDSLDVGDLSPESLVDFAVLQQDLAAEIADTVIYLDLLAARAGIDLSEAVRAKFNAVSDRVASGVYL